MTKPPTLSQSGLATIMSGPTAHHGYPERERPPLDRELLSARQSATHWPYPIKIVLVPLGAKLDNRGMQHHAVEYRVRRSLTPEGCWKWVGAFRR
jgi:hypothetical protein